MLQIRTPKGKLYGILTLKDYMLHIKDGKDKRVIQVPREGLKLIYITGTKQPEEIHIPPQQFFTEIIE